MRRRRSQVVIICDFNPLPNVFLSLSATQTFVLLLDSVLIRTKKLSSRLRTPSPGTGNGFHRAVAGLHEAASGLINDGGLRGR